MDVIVDFLAAHAARAPDRLAFTYIDDEGVPSEITYSLLYENARLIAHNVLKHVEVGDPVVLLLPQGLDYIQTFLGCLYAGVIAVPLYPLKNKKHTGRVLAVTDSCQARVAITTEGMIELAKTSLTSLSVVDVRNLCEQSTDKNSSFSNQQAVAFLQYTTGSTGAPKGVMVSHNNIIANLASLQEATRCSDRDVFCNWLPLFHDLGLVNTILLPIFLGAHSVLMSPARFMRRPLGWLEAISAYKASICGAPNFAFDYCVDRLQSEQIIEAGLELSHWRVAFNAAEPINPKTLQRFSAFLQPVGFKSLALYPSYGMAEATVFIAGGDPAGYQVHAFDADALHSGIAIPAASELPASRSLVACGKVQSGHTLKIVDEYLLEEVPSGRVGEIWFAGPSVACGYWNEPELSAAVFNVSLAGDHNAYLRTGDLGFIHDGQLFIAGRIKDILIINGRNYYPQDLERVTSEAYEGIRHGSVVAFEVDARPLLVVEVEPRFIKQFNFEQAAKNIRADIFDDFDLLIADVMFVRAGSLPKTSSGKVQRSKTKTYYTDEQFERLGPSVSNGVPTPKQAPTNSLETALLSLWQTLLDRDDIGIDDNFFAVGGHSLGAMQLIAAIRSSWECDISIRRLFEGPTIRELAVAISAATPGTLPPITKNATAPLQASYPQQQLWLNDRISGGGAHYSISGRVTLTGALDTLALSRSFTTIVARHESLRTCFEMAGEGQLMQVIQPAGEFIVNYRDFSGLESHVRESELNQCIQEELMREFDLSCDVMLRVSVLTVALDEHVLLVTMHHIASDGWSMGILLQEFSQLYTAYEAGQVNPLPVLPIQYANYANWQRTYWRDDGLSRQLEYWEKQLSGLPLVHSVPLDHMRPAQQRFFGNCYRRVLPKETLDALRSLCQEEGATLFMGLQTLFSILLSRYSNEVDIVMGCPIANREREETASLIGFFVNTLVLRSDLTGAPGFRELLHRNKLMLLDAYTHQHVPFEQLVERLQPERSLSHTPLFQIMLVLQNNEELCLSLPGLQVGQLEQDVMFSRYDLMLNVEETTQGLMLSWEYNTDLFDASTIERMACHFEILSAGAVAAPQANVFTMPLISHSEQRQLLVDWNQTAANYPRTHCIHELFEAHVNDTPDAPAVIVDGQSLSYRELNTRANQLAHYLVEERAIRPDTLVGLCTTRSLEMVIGIMGILKAGAAYVPIDPDYPLARVEYMLKDASLSTIVTELSIREQLQLAGAQCVCLDDERIAHRLEAYPGTNLAVGTLGVTPAHLAYVIYTSGSTGNPKGVMVEHGSLVNYVSAFESHCHGLSGSFVNTNICFDGTATSFWVPLAFGKYVKLSTSSGVDSLAILISEVCDSVQSQLFKVTPAHLDVLMGVVANNSAHNVKHRFFVGGDVFLTQKYQALPDSIRRFDFINHYGPSEATVGCTTYPIANDLLLASNSIPLGKPLANVQLYVLDKMRQLSPVGVIGELYIGGAGVARGYLNRPELTVEKFIDNPFYADDDSSRCARLYKTGDLVRWLPGGILEFLGRVDHQVKIRGFRIELGEIENALAGHDGVSDALVQVMGQDKNDKYLVAYVIWKCSDLSETAALSAGLLLDYLARRLPDYMIPAQLVLLDAWPLTPNGKVDRNALPKPEGFLPQAGYIAPATDIEKIVCAIWQDVLGVERVGLEDNFFRLGGHSLRVMQVISRLQHHGLSVQARDIFAAPTPAGLSKRLGSATSSITVAVISPSGQIPLGCERITAAMVPMLDLSDEDILQIERSIPGGASNIQEIYPLAPQQEGILFHHLLSSGGDPYVYPILLGLHGKTVDDFIAALQFVIGRHDSLRTAFIWKGLASPVQVVCRDVLLPVVWPEIDTARDIQDQMQERCAHQYQIMDLGAAPLVSLEVAADPVNNRHLVLFKNHHIIMDHVAIEIALREMQLFLDGNVHTLPPAAPYREFVWQARQQNNPTEEAVNFFRGTFGDIEETTAPFNLIDLNGDGSNIGEAKAPVLKALSDQIRHIAHRLGVIPAVFFHTAWAMVIAGCSGRNDLVFGTVLSGRLQGTNGAENMFGMCINTLPLRVKLEGVSAIEAMFQVRDSLAALLPYEQVSAAFVKTCSGLPNDLSLFSAILNYRHSSPESSVILDRPDYGSPIKILSIEERSNYPLTLNIDDSGVGFGLEIQIDRQLNAERVLGYLQTAIVNLISALEKCPDERITGLPILPATEQRQLLVDWNKTAADYPRTHCIHELFEAHAKESPDALAVIVDGQSLSYGELNSRANQLAHYLVEERAIRPDTLVGLCTTRSLDMVIGILGILKAGGAYVPIDPDYPLARVEYMLKDASLSTIVTQLSIREQLQLAETQCVCLDEERVGRHLSTYPGANLAAGTLGVTPDHLAYVIYTSGSTGNPKGVMVEHGSLVNFLWSMRSAPGMQRDDCLLAITSTSFDIHGLELFLPLVCGATFMVADRDSASDPQKLIRLMENHGVTMLQATPATWKMLVGTGWHPPAHLKMLCGGEALSPTLAAALTVTPGAILWNMYGPTETTIWSCIEPLNNKSAGIGIGAPIGNTQVYVVGDGMSLSPVGVPGELLIGGKGVARGYLNQPVLSAEKFIPNPFYDPRNPDSSRRLYRTGDLVRWSDGSRLEYLGRIDHQVKIRGFRVELGEIENRLMQHPGIKDAVVLARGAVDEIKQLVCYLVAEEHNEFHAIDNVDATLREYIVETLPAYMVPAIFIILKDLPLTPNGKVDRKFLTTLEVLNTGKKYQAPVTETEIKLCNICEEILGVKKISILDDFIALGGNSIQAAHVIMQINRAFSINMSIQEVFKSKNLSELGANIDDNVLMSSALKQQDQQPHDAGTELEVWEI